MFLIWVFRYSFPALFTLHKIQMQYAALWSLITELKQNYEVYDNCIFTVLGILVFYNWKRSFPFKTALTSTFILRKRKRYFCKATTIEPGVSPAGGEKSSFPVVQRQKIQRNHFSSLRNRRFQYKQAEKSISSPPGGINNVFRALRITVYLAKTETKA